jgi:hypothetical protein
MRTRDDWWSDASAHEDSQHEPPCAHGQEPSECDACDEDAAAVAAREQEDRSVMDTDTTHLQREFTAATAQRSLTQIVDQILTILQDVDTADGEVTPDQDALLATLDLSLEQKVEAYAAAHARLGAEAEALKDLAKTYSTKAKARETSAELLRMRLHAEMSRLGRDVVKTPTASARIQASPDRLELEEQDDAALFSRFFVPDELIVTTRRLDRKAVLAALKSGRELAFAWIGHNTHLRFR